MVSWLSSETPYEIHLSEPRGKPGPWMPACLRISPLCISTWLSTPSFSCPGKGTLARRAGFPSLAHSLAPSCFLLWFRSRTAPRNSLSPRQSCLKCISLIMRRKSLRWKGEREGGYQGEVVCRLGVPISLFQDFSFCTNEGRVTLYCPPWGRGVAPDAIPLLFRFPVWGSRFLF